MISIRKSRTCTSILLVFIFLFSISSASAGFGDGAGDAIFRAGATLVDLGGAIVDGASDLGGAIVDGASDIIDGAVDCVTGTEEACSDQSNQDCPNDCIGKCGVSRTCNGVDVYCDSWTRIAEDNCAVGDFAHSSFYCTSCQSDCCTEYKVGQGYDGGMCTPASSSSRCWPARPCTNHNKDDVSIIGSVIVVGGSELESRLSLPTFLIEGCASPALPTDTCAGYCNKAENGTLAPADECFCCNSGFNVDHFCCNEYNCSESVNVVMDPSGSGKCDADNDGLYCGVPSCAGDIPYFGATIQTANGSCSCVRDIPRAFFEEGTMITTMPIAVDSSGPQNPVKVYNLSVSGNEPELTSILFSYCNKNTCSTVDWQYRPQLAYPANTNPSVYLDGERINVQNLSFKFVLGTTNTSRTPWVTKVGVTHFPRLYNFSSNIVQGKGQSVCWPIENMEIDCDLGQNAISQVNCATSENMTAVEAYLIGTGYREINPDDNVALKESDDWCYNPTNDNFRNEDTGTSCTSNLQCEFKCCAPNLQGSGRSCQSPTVLYDSLSGKTYSMFRDRDCMESGGTEAECSSYCGAAPYQLSATSSDCSTYCSKIDDPNRETCVYPNDEGTNCIPS